MFGGDPPDVTAPVGKVLLRVFVHFYGEKVVLLLGGYDKGEDPKERRQQRDCSRAQAACPVQGAATPGEAIDAALTVDREFPILVGRRCGRMAPSYQDVVAKRRSRLSPQAREQQKVFVEAYDIALRDSSTCGRSTGSRRLNWPSGPASLKRTSAESSGVRHTRRRRRCSASPRPSMPTSV